MADPLSGREIFMEAAALEPSGKRERAKAANREAILVAARGVFASIGYEAATVRDIIRGTDLASGTFYNYFRSKEEVFEALSDDSARRFKPILHQVRERSTSFEDYVHTSLAAFFAFIAHEYETEGRPAAERRPHMRTDTPEMIAVYEEVRAGLEEAIARGMAPPIDADYMACACIGMAQEVGAAMLRREPRDIEAAASFCAELILRGLGGAPRRT
jgi:AcrR family transcriptional regulator